MNMEKSNSLIKLFENKKVRVVWDDENDEWFLSIQDVVEILTESTDVKQYIKRMLSRDIQLKSNWGTNCTPVEMIAADGKRRKVQASNIQGIFRIIQSIPSPKAEPFKQWLAQVAKERLDQLQDPELSIYFENMKTLEKSIATAMDSTDAAIVPFLPYILQDFWEMGTSPDVVVDFVERYCANVKTRHATSVQVLDLGCGKGAVSVKLAVALKCQCFGIDGIPEFIDTAKEKATEYGVDTLCRFEVGDIREKIHELGKFDVIILGAVGQVFGNYHTTLTTLSEHLSPEGIIIIDDAYIDDASTFQHPSILPRRELLKQIGQAEMELIDEKTNSVADSAKEFENLQKRCRELIAKYPEKTSLFEDYIKNQTTEYDVLDNKVICSTMVFIFSRPFSINRASQRVLEKAGFALEAQLKNAIYKNGEYMDELIYVKRRNENG